MESREGAFEFPIPEEAGEIQALALDLADLIERYATLFPDPPVSAARLRAWTHALGEAIVDGVILEQEVRRHRATLKDAMVRLKNGLGADLRILEGPVVKPRLAAFLRG